MIGAALFVLGARAIHAATFAIANGDVAGLKIAIATANGNAQDDAIELAAGGIYTLTARDSFLNGLPAIAPDGGHKLTIHGHGATIERVPAVNDSAHRFRIFYNNSGANLTLSDLTITNGNPGAFHGGAIYNDGETADATLTISNCTLTGNSGDYGGAIFNDGYQDPSFPAHTATLTVLNSTISFNTGTQYGGGIWNESGGIVMNVSNCTFSQNSAVARSAGAIQFDGSSGTATGSISNCTFTENTAGNYGGAVNIDGFAGSGTLEITQCTFDQNSAKWGGGVAMDGTSGSAAVNVSNSTFSGNSATLLGGGIYLSTTGAGTTSLQIGNTILAAGASGDNLTIAGGGTITSQGYNLSSDDAGGGAGTGPGGLLNHAGDQRNTDPLLDPSGLKDNVGPTMTIALQAGSPAIDQGKRNTISASDHDQRGEPRPFDDPAVANASGGDGSDIGAYEADVRITAQDRLVNDLRLTFTTTLGHNYEVQSTLDLILGPWTTVPGTLSVGTGGIVQVTITNALIPPKVFYRVHQLP